MMSRVKMMDEPRMTIETEKKAPIMGTDCEVGGVTSATIPRKTVTDSRLVVSEWGGGGN